MSSTTRRTMLVGGSAFTIAGTCALDASRATAGVVTIAASVDFSNALPGALAAFSAADGSTPAVDYVSLADITRRVREGARPDLLLGADEAVFLTLAADGFLKDAGTPVAEGRLALIVNRRSPLAGDVSLGAIAEAARNGDLFRIALADPENAPYGQRAVEVLERWSVDQLLRPRLVYTDDDAEAVRHVVKGHTAVGLVAKSLSAAPAVARAVHLVDIPHGWHRPLVQRIALARDAGAGAHRLFAFLRSEPTLQLLTRHGYARPGQLD